MPENALRKDMPAQIGPLIRDRRRRLSMTLQALSELSGVSVGYLSHVERGNATPSLATIAQIAQALGLDMSYFVTSSRAADSVTRADERTQFTIAGRGNIYERLGADFPGAELSSYLITSPPGHSAEQQSHEGEEMLFVLEGEIEHSLNGERFTLRAGDSAHFRGSNWHSWRNLTDKPARLLWVGTLPVLRDAATKGRLPNTSVSKNNSIP